MLPLPSKRDKINHLKLHIKRFIKKNIAEESKKKLAGAYRLVDKGVNEVHANGLLIGSPIYNYPEFYLPTTNDGPEINLVPKIAATKPLYSSNIPMIMKDGTIIHGSGVVNGVYVPSNQLIFLRETLRPRDFLEALVHEVGHWVTDEAGFDHLPWFADGGFSFFGFTADGWELYFKKPREKILTILYDNFPFVKERTSRNQRLFYIGSQSRRFPDYLVLDEFFVTLRSIIAWNNKYPALTPDVLSAHNAAVLFTKKGRDTVVNFCWPSNKVYIPREED